MADHRLEELRTSDMTESAVNLELVEWLKKHGMNVLLAVLLIILAVVGWNWYQERQRQFVSDAWATLSGVDTVASYEGIAEQYEDVGAIAELAWLRAAQIHMNTLRADESQLIEPEEEAEGEGEAETESETVEEEQEDEAPKPMTPEERQDLLDKVERLYSQTRESASADSGKTIIQIKALFGLAAVAEMRGDLERATALYDEVTEVAEETYPQLAALGAARQATLVEATTPIEFPTDAEVMEMRRLESGDAPSTFTPTMPALPEAEGPQLQPAPPLAETAPPTQTEGEDGADSGGDEGEAPAEDPEAPAPASDEPPSSGGGGGR